MTQTRPLSDAGAAGASPQQQWSPRVSAAMLARLAARAAVADRAVTTAVEAPFTGAVLPTVPNGRPPTWRRRPRGARSSGGVGAPSRRGARPRCSCASTTSSRQCRRGHRRHPAGDRQGAQPRVRRGARRRRAGALLRARRREVPARAAHRGPSRCSATRGLHRPRGVIGFVTPWNYPLTLAMADALAALVAGNGVVPETRLADALHRPSGRRGCSRRPGCRGACCRSSPVAGPSSGSRWSTAVDYMMFTGSTATGRTVAAHAAAPAQGLLDGARRQERPAGAPDAGLTRASRGRCTASRQQRPAVRQHRTPVRARRRLRRLRARLAERLTPVRWARASRSARTWALSPARRSSPGRRRTWTTPSARGRRCWPAAGPARPRAVLLRADAARRRGPRTWQVCRNETFGPVAAVYRCSSVDEMVRARQRQRVRAQRQRLDARHRGRARRSAARLQAGTVNVNEAYAATWASAAPMGGLKQSGMGRRHGRHGILKYTDPQTVSVQRLLHGGTPPFLSHAQYAESDDAGRAPAQARARDRVTRPGRERHGRLHDAGAGGRLLGRAERNSWRQKSSPG